MKGRILTNMNDTRLVWRRLFAVPKDEIVKSLRLKLTEDTLIELFQDLYSEKTTLEQIGRASHRQLIQIAERADNFTEEDANRLNEEFRYRGTKSLYLGCFSVDVDALVAQKFDDAGLEQFDKIVQEIFNKELRSSTNKKYEQLSIRERDNFDIEENKLWEISYSYVAIVRTTDPETEESKFHPDLRYSFVWINYTNPWVAISAKDEAVAAVLFCALANYLGIVIDRLPIPKDVELAIEQYDKVRRATHVDERGVRTRVSHESLYDFPEEVADLQRRDRQSERMSSGYNVKLNDDEFVFNYSRDKGAISFSKLLPTSLLRDFGVRKINDIYCAVQEFKLNSPEVLIPEIIHRALLNSRGKTKELVTKIISKLISARQSGRSEIDIDTDPFDITSLKKFFSFAAQGECEYCDDLQNIQCICHNKNLVVQDRQIICSKCNSLVETGDSHCIFGHDIYISDPTQLLTWYPTSSFYEVVESVTSQVSQAKFNRYEEGFFIKGRTLHIFGIHGNKSVYLVNNIPELAALSSVNLPEEQNRPIFELLNGYKEKCQSMSHANCSVCVANRVGTHCLMRLFGLFDSSYTPRPHHNGEFGDVALSITIDGHQQQTMVILLKSGTVGGNPITMRHSIGQDLYTQLVSFWTDPRVAMIGIAVPQRIEDGFVVQLRRLARQYGKKLIFFGLSELANMIHYVTMQRNLQLEEL